MAYKFQLGAARLSGSLVQEGDLEAQGSGEFTSLKIQNDSTIGVIGDLDMITFSSGSDVAVGSGLDFIVQKVGGFNLADGAVTSTAAELNLLDGVAGLIQADFTKLAAVDASAAELNLLDAVARGSIVYGNASAASALLGKGAAHTFLQSDGADIAYVAMSGDATLAAGAITIANNAVSLAKMAGITRGSIISGDASGDPQYLAKGNASEFLQSDGTDVAYVAMSGDATLSAGALSIGATKVTDAMINDDVADALAGAGSTATTGVINIIGGDGITANANDIEVTPAQTTITSVKNDALVVGRATGNDHIDFASAGNVKVITNNVARLTITDTSTTIAGNLIVEGTTSTIDSTTINISSSFTFEGPADAHETTFHAGTPTTDLTVYLPQFSASAGTQSFYIPALIDASTDASSKVLAAEFALLDGGSTIGSDAVVNGDGFMHNDNGVMKHTNVLKIAEYAFAKFSGDATVSDSGALTIAATAVQGSMLNDDCISGQGELASGLASTDEFMVSDGGVLKRMDVAVLSSYLGTNISNDVQNVSAAGTLVVGINYFSDMGSDGEDAVTLPASPAVGQSVKVKAPSDCGSGRFITINKAGSQTIDGAASIRLESPFAAVELIYVASNLWRVF